MTKNRKTSEPRTALTSVVLLVGVLLLILGVLAVTTVRNVQSTRQLMLGALTTQGELVVRTLEGVTRAGLRHQIWGLLRMQSLVEETLRQPNLRSLVVMAPRGEVLAAGVSEPNVATVEKAALEGLPPEVMAQVQHRLPVTVHLKKEVVVGRPFEPLAVIRRGPRPLPSWARPPQPGEPLPPPPGSRSGSGMGRGMGRDMERHHMEMMGWLDKDAPPGYVLVRLSTASFRKAQARVIGTSLLLAFLVFLAAALMAGAMFFYARRRQSELLRLRQEVDQSRHLAAVGRLAGSVAHEVRNPLSALRGLVQYLGKGAAPGSRQEECARTAVSEVDRLERVVSGLLDYTRNREPRLVTMDLGESLKATLALLADEPRAQGVELKAELPPGLPLVLADPDQVRQIVMNLLLNALEANNGQGRILLRTSSQEGWLRLEVADQGPGLPPGDPDQLFDPFFSTKDRGTGLGLAIARRLAHGLGGELSAANGPAGGAVFTLSLPVSEA
ncbi:MAG: ATP-binding protein [Thermodesulfobacteriota bacterium]